MTIGSTVISGDEGDGAYPLPVPLRPLLPGGLPAGAAVTTGGDYPLLLALAAAATAGTAPWAVVGLPALGGLAAAGAGLDLTGGLWVDEPAGRWEAVITALLTGAGVVLLGELGAVPDRVARRVQARAHRSGAVLLAAGQWPGAQLRLRVSDTAWAGLGRGSGLLRGRLARVTATGRGIPPGRFVDVWLPGPDGRVQAADRAAYELGGGLGGVGLPAVDDLTG